MADGWVHGRDRLQQVTLRSLLESEHRIMPAWAVAEDGHDGSKGWGGSKMWGVVPMGGVGIMRVEGEK